jgi:prolipoprotein diacylglyceryltransferase
MFKIMLALHLLFAIFAVGPLVFAATTAGRGVRRGDAAEVASAARVLRWYSLASVLVVIFGLALMSAKPPWGGDHTAEFSDPYIWISLILWVAAMGVVHGFVLPQLGHVGEKLAASEAVSAFTAKIAAAGGLVGVIFAVIIFLMVYKPGS